MILPLILFALLVQPAPPQPADSPAITDTLVKEQRSLQSLELVDADPEEHGRVAVGSRLIRRLTFVNKLDREVFVEVLSTTCGCTKASFDTLTVGPASYVALTAIVDVAATPGPQMQTVRFKSSWNVADETGVCAVKYEPEIDYETLPSMIRRSAPAGSNLQLNTWVHWPGEVAKRQRIHDLSCSLPGFSHGAVRAITDGPNVLAVQFSGAVPPPGAYRGDIYFQVDPADKPVRVPVFLRSLAPWVATPGGAIFDGPLTVCAVELKPDQPSAQPSAIRLRNPDAPIRAFLEPADAAKSVRTLRVERSGELTTCGGTVIEVLDSDGNILVLIPVAYFALPREP